MVFSYNNNNYYINMCHYFATTTTTTATAVIIIVAVAVALAFCFITFEPFERSDPIDKNNRTT